VLLLRPPRVYRAAGWAFVLFAILFGLVGVVQDGSGPYNWAAGALVEILSALFLGFGISISTASATVTSSHIRYRYGFVRRVIPSGEVESVARPRQRRVLLAHLSPHRSTRRSPAASPDCPATA